MRGVLLACALAIGVPACGGDDAKMERMIEILEEVGAAAKSGGDDCTKVAAALKSTLDKRKGELAELKSWSESLAKDQEKAEKLMSKYMDRMMTASMSMMAASDKCADHPDYQKVSETITAMM